MDTTVVIKGGRNSRTYHVNDDGMPACGVRESNDPDSWREWGIEKAQAWKSPCQRPRCYGESAEERPEETADAWPV